MYKNRLSTDIQIYVLPYPQHKRLALYIHIVEQTFQRLCWYAVTLVATTFNVVKEPTLKVNAFMVLEEGWLKSESLDLDLNLKSLPISVYGRSRCKAAGCRANATPKGHII